MKNNLMLDLETFGETPNSAILSIAAVQFDIQTGEYGKEFEVFIDLQSCLDAGLHITGHTIEWWLEQDKEAQMKYLNAEKVSLQDALELFTKFVADMGNVVNTLVWGNPAKFDIGLLQDAYRITKKEFPDIRHYNERDLKTLSAVNPDFKKNEPDYGVPHNAIDDCKFQINYLVKLWKYLSK